MIVDVKPRAVAMSLQALGFPCQCTLSVARHCGGGHSAAVVEYGPEDMRICLIRLSSVFCPGAALVMLACLMLAGCASRSTTGEATTSVEAALSREAASTATTPSSPIRFRDITGELHVDWTYHDGREANVFSIVESMGGGQALCDYDQDGRLDIVAAGGGEFPMPGEIRGLPPGLLRQLPSGTFENVALPAQLNDRRFFSHGIAAGDYDHDGFSDLAITGYGGVVLYHNCGDGTFRDAGRGTPEFVGGWSTSAGWADVNHDDHPDLLVIHYADWSFQNNPPCPGPSPHFRDICPPRKFQGLPDQLFLSDGQGGFVECAESRGLTSRRKGIGMAIADLDLDGDLDLYVTNDTDPNDYYRNDGAGHFEEIGLEAGVALGADGNSDGSMGVDIGDYNGDGLPDIWVTNFEREVFALYRNLGSNQFQHVSRQVGINLLSGNHVGWGTVMFDADSDGDKDIFVTNGHVIRFPDYSPVEQRPLMLENVAGDHFRDITDTTGDYFALPHAGRSVSVGDIDADLDPDLIVSAVNQPLVILANESSWQGFAVRLIGRRSPRQPIGAVLRLRRGERTSMEQLTRGGGYASTAADTLFFGGAIQPADQLEIEWPSGIKQVVQPGSGQRLMTVIEPL